MITKSSNQMCWLWIWVWLALLGYNYAHSAVVGDAALVDAGDLFVTPKPLFGKHVGVSGGGVLCIDENHCVIENPLSPTLFIKLNTRLMKPEDKHRLAKECHQLLCSEFLIGSLFQDGFVATRSYASQHLLPSQTPAPSFFSKWDLPEWKGMSLRWGI